MMGEYFLIEKCSNKDFISFIIREEESVIGTIYRTSLRNAVIWYEDLYMLKREDIRKVYYMAIAEIWLLIGTNKINLDTENLWAIFIRKSKDMMWLEKWNQLQREKELLRQERKLKKFIEK